jgi:hypothetical protein
MTMMMMIWISEMPHDFPEGKVGNVGGNGH